jgi:hypothetical protein
MYLFFVFLFSGVFLFLPSSLILGYKARGSAGYAVELFRDMWLKYFVAAVLPLLFAFLPMAVMSLYAVPWYVEVPVNLIFYTLVGHYYICLAFTAFYEKTGFERRDNLRGFHNN